MRIQTNEYALVGNIVSWRRTLTYDAVYATRLPRGQQHRILNSKSPVSSVARGVGTHARHHASTAIKPAPLLYHAYVLLKERLVNVYDLPFESS